MMSERAKAEPRERPLLVAKVGQAKSGPGLEFWCEDENGNEYELHGQISFTYDRDWPADITQVAVVTFCDERYKPPGWK